MSAVSKHTLELPAAFTLDELLEDTPTPTNLQDLTKNYSGHGGLLTIDIYLKLFAMQYGRVYGFAQEQNGATVQNLFPIKKHEADQISSSSKATLEMHTETAFHPWRPKTVCLLCIRGDENAGTTYSLLNDILTLLNQETIDILHEPLFVTKIDQSFTSVDHGSAMIVTPILFDNSSRMTYDRALMAGMTERASEALHKFSRAVDECKQVTYLDAGDILVLQNDYVIHGRTPFQPKYDGTDRWLKRVMVRPGPFNPAESTVGPDGLFVVTTSF